MKITITCICGKKIEFESLSVEFTQSDECKKWMAEHQPHTPTKGNWEWEISSGYGGYRCSNCGTWVYEREPRRCKCDE